MHVSMDSKKTREILRYGVMFVKLRALSKIVCVGGSIKAY